jgi:Uncharacterised protein conserved in bacteria (DUF2336)
MIRTALARLFGRRPAVAPPPAGFDPKTLARSPDPAVRQAVAGAPDTLPELLYFLARDPVPAVRAAVARNHATPRKADLLLALDEVPEIRTLIAEKIAAQVQPDSPDEAAQLWQLTVSVLEALAHDNLPSVRHLVAEMARGLNRMPVGIVTSLGRDRIADVAVPALGYPGTIPDRDLVEIVTQSPDPRVVGAVARRPSIGPSVAERIVDSGDSAAIAELLQNRSAEIPPMILEGVVDRAPPIEAWHEPLVHRPVLSESAAMRLASFVADRLVRVLQSRTDLDPATTNAIATLLQDRPATATAPPPVPSGGTIIMTGAEPGDSPLSRARHHLANGTLTEDVVGAALGTDQDFIIAALALRSRLKPAVVNKILLSHSAKGLTALAWKAGYTMRLAFQLQVRLAHLPPKSRLNATSGGGYPLTPAEMEWQIEFFQSLVPAGM